MMDVFFKSEWSDYLKIYGFFNAPDETFYQTARNTISLLAKEEVNVLHRALSQEVYMGIAPVRVLPYEYDRLFDGTLELILTDRYNEQHLLNVYKEVIRYNQERYNDQLPPTDNTSAKTDITPDIIDISNEGSKIDYGNAPLSNASTVDNTPSYYDENAKLGHKYKEKLYLNPREVSWLNKFWNPDNIFLSVEGCCIAVIRLYLVCIKAVDKEHKQRDSAVEQCIDDLVTQIMNAVHAGSNDPYYKERIEADIYLTIFKRAENVVRELYSHKRKLSEDFLYEKFKRNFESTIGNYVSHALTNKTNAVPPPDRVTEIQLNAQNNTRWRIFFDNIAQKLSKDNYNDSLQEMLQLTASNINNPQKEYIFFEASKLFAAYNREDAVSFYLKYIHADLRSEKVDNKQLPKTVHKSLFKTDQERQAFELVANSLIQTLNLKAALSEVPSIFIKKRKKIQLDTSAIDAVVSAHTQTVNLLNELLQDDEPETNTAPADTEVSVNLLPAVVEINTPSEIAFSEGLIMNAHQLELIMLFKTNLLSLPTETVGSFARQRKLFKDQLIESINSACYEKLDDLLIEEIEDTYTINEIYFQTITS